MKIGVDVLHTNFTRTSSSSPVQIFRGDGTLARTLVFGLPAAQTVSSTDLAAFVQDRVQLHPRVLVELGGRIDRDGVFQETNVTPRVGAVWMLDSRGTSLLRGGYGLFYERTPSAVGAFRQFETMFETRYAADGSTPLGPPRQWQYVSPLPLHVARSAVWNAEYDFRLGKSLSFRAGMLNRQGDHEIVIRPVAEPRQPSTGSLLMTSDGHSSYIEGELTVRYAPNPNFDVSATYVRSSALANLNTYTAFFNNIRSPVISTDEYAPTANNAPNRLVTRTRAIFADRWLISSIFELHSGFPYSVLDGNLDWVGPRNQGYYFPTLALLDLGLEHRFTFLKGKPWIGVRLYNALDRFSPTEVQANLSSPDFGRFYNSVGRQIRVQVRFGFY
jgi:hypothetical protein